MRIAVLPSWYPSDEDPLGGIFIRDQVVALSRHHEVAVICPDVTEPRLGGRVRRPTSERRDGALVLREPARAAVPGSRGSAIVVWRNAAARGLRRLLDGWGSPDILHAHVSLPAGWAAVSAARDTSVPVVLTEHLGPFDPARTAPRQLKKIREALEGSAAVVAVGPSLREEILAFRPGLSVEVVGDVVDSATFVPGSALREHSRRFVSVGSLDEVKGHDLLIEAVRELVAQHAEPFQVVIVGDGPLRAALERSAAGLPVSFVGSLAREEVRELLRSSTAFVSASRHESFGVAVAEALSCGIPAIATRNGGAEFVVAPECGVLVEKGSPHALAEAMRDLDPAAFDAQAIRASVVDRFGEDAFLENITPVYDRVLGSV